MCDTSEELDEGYSPRITAQAALANPLGNTKILHLDFDLDPFMRYQTAND